MVDETCPSPWSSTTSPPDSSLHGFCSCPLSSCTHRLLTHASFGTPSKSSVELMKEIATLEANIMQLDHYLLLLYRQKLPSLLRSHGLKGKVFSHHQTADYQQKGEGRLEFSPFDSGHDYQIFPSCAGPGQNSQIHAALMSSPGKERHKVVSGHRSLADYLGASHLDDILDYPDRLSREILRCISSIYCKFPDSSLSQRDLSVSSTSSWSSSSTFSPTYMSSRSSPHINEEVKGHFNVDGLKDDSAISPETIQVLNISLDDDTSRYAARMLQRFRYLVQSLEKVDPKKMKCQGKLAFWLNIHNSLVMHACLAYGIHGFVKSTSVLKAAYNVGGLSVNACEIQSSILGIRSHYSTPWLKSLVSPRKRFMPESERHPYAIEYLEPLVHFALASGTYSDPVVRVYTSKDVFRELEAAKKEFLQSNIDTPIQQDKKIYLPKVLYYYSKDMAISMSELLEIVCRCLPETQQNAIRSCIKRGHDKLVQWTPENWSFRYQIHKNTAQGVEYKNHTTTIHRNTLPTPVILSTCKMKAFFSTFH